MLINSAFCQFVVDLTRDISYQAGICQDKELKNSF